MKPSPSTRGSQLPDPPASHAAPTAPLPPFTLREYLPETLRGRALLAVAIAALLGLLFWCYSPSLHGEFTNWDDERYVPFNELLRMPFLKMLKPVWFGYYFANYHPLTILSYWVEYQLVGLNPFLYHLNNLLLHIGNTFLVALLFLRLSRSAPASFVAAIIFAFHPLRVESVAWIAERKDVLYSFFYLAALLAYLHYLEARSPRRYFACLGLFLLSLFSKSMAVTLPVILLLLDYHQQRPLNPRALLEKLPFFALSLLFGILAVFSQFESSALNLRDEGTSPVEDVISRLTVACYNIFFYIGKSFWPEDLRNFYRYPFIAPLQLPPYFLALPPLAAAFLAAYFYVVRKNRHAVFWMLFYLFTAAPVLNFITVGMAIAADRYSYIPCLGFALLPCQAVVYLYRRWFPNADVRKVAGALALILLAVFVPLKYSQARIWRSSDALWRDLVAKDPLCYVGHSNLSSWFITQGQILQALESAQRAIDLEKSAPQPFNNRGVAYSFLNEVELAAADLNYALKLSPKFIDAQKNLAGLYLVTRQFDLAIEHYNRALRLSPKDYAIFAFRGSAYEQQGKHELAFQDFTTAITYAPLNPEVYYIRSAAFNKTRRFEQAIADLDRAIALNPAKARYWSDRGSAWHGLLDADKAMADYNEALRLSPRHAEALNNRGNLYLDLGDTEKAIRDLTAALESNDRIPITYNNRAVAYFKNDKFEESEKDAIKALSLGHKLHPEFRAALEKALGRTLPETTEVKPAQFIPIKPQG